MKFRKILAVGVAAVASFALAACGTGADAAPEPDTAPGDAAEAPDTTPDADDITIGFAVSTLHNPVFAYMAEGITSEAAASGVDVTIADAQDDALQQANDILDFIAMGVDIALINPVDGDAIATSVEALNDAGIPVITLGRRAFGGDVVAHIGTDNIRAGQDAARTFFEELGGEGNVAILNGIPGASSAVDRRQGVEDVLADFPGITIVAEQTANWQRSEGMTVTENILQANPQLDGILSLNDEMALGAIEALRAAGRLEGVSVLGIDGTADAIEAISSGELFATFDQQTALIGRTGVQQALIVLDGGTIEAEQPVPMYLIDSSNYTDFR